MADEARPSAAGDGASERPGVHGAWTDEAWDAYVRRHPLATYLQTAPWATRIPSGPRR